MCMVAVCNEFVIRVFFAYLTSISIGNELFMVNSPSVQAAQGSSVLKASYCRYDVRNNRLPLCS